MLIHVYTSVAPGYPRDTPQSQSHSHIGNGLGSLFGRLFSRIGSRVASASVKSALKSVAKTGVQIGKKALSSAVKQAAPLARDALKEGITSATNFGAEKAIETIGNLADKSIKHGAPESLAHSLAKAAEKGTRAVASTTQQAVNSSVDKILSTPKPTKVGRKRPKSKATTDRKPPAKSRKTAPKTTPNRPKSITNLLDEI